MEGVNVGISQKEIGIDMISLVYGLSEVSHEQWRDLVCRWSQPFVRMSKTHFFVLQSGPFKLSEWFFKNGRCFNANEGKQISASHMIRFQTGSDDPRKKCCGCGGCLMLESTRCAEMEKRANYILRSIRQSMRIEHHLCPSGHPYVPLLESLNAKFLSWKHSWVCTLAKGPHVTIRQSCCLFFVVNICQEQQS